MTSYADLGVGLPAWELLPLDDRAQITEWLSDLGLERTTTVSIDTEADTVTAAVIVTDGHGHIVVDRCDRYPACVREGRECGCGVRTEERTVDMDYPPPACWPAPPPPLSNATS